MHRVLGLLAFGFVTYALAFALGFALSQSVEARHASRSADAADLIAEVSRLRQRVYTTTINSDLTAVKLDQLIAELEPRVTLPKEPSHRTSD